MSSNTLKYITMNYNVNLNLHDRLYGQYNIDSSLKVQRKEILKTAESFNKFEQIVEFKINFSSSSTSGGITEVNIKSQQLQLDLYKNQNKLQEYALNARIS
ncbi:33714_t:CDS:2 [Gigaspora margarita]|uniref:33714_t:CDS:1 n=1 Tax=Gigaspora margarita TaxID=4874 RepID=A0ABM8VW18_GIGMA|nr:33714_t:CDS:2 [Gigaspora margarita]